MLNRREFFASIAAIALSPIGLPAAAVLPAVVPCSRYRLAIEHHKRRMAEVEEALRLHVAIYETAWRKELEIQQIFREEFAKLPNRGARHEHSAKSDSRKK